MNAMLGAPTATLAACSSEFLTLLYLGGTMRRLLCKNLDRPPHEREKCSDQRLTRAGRWMSIALSFLIACTLSLRSDPAQAFTPEQELIYQGCINSLNPDLTFVQVKQYVEIQMRAGGRLHPHP